MVNMGFKEEIKPRVGLLFRKSFKLLYLVKRRAFISSLVSSHLPKPGVGVGAGKNHKNKIPSQRRNELKRNISMNGWQRGLVVSVLL